MAFKSKIPDRLIMGCRALGDKDFAVAALGIAFVIAAGHGWVVDGSLPGWCRAGGARMLPK